MAGHLSPGSGSRCPLSAPSQAPGPQVLQTSPVGVSRSWTQTAKQGVTGKLWTSSSRRKEWRERPPQARRTRMQGRPPKRKRLWTLWASCGRSPGPGEPLLLAGSRASGDDSSPTAGSRKLHLWAVALSGHLAAPSPSTSPYLCGWAQVSPAPSWSQGGPHRHLLARH